MNRHDKDDRDTDKTLKAQRPHLGKATTAPVLVGLVVLCALPELLLTGTDLGLWGSPRWRTIAYQWGAFWPGLLGNWRPNYSGQPVAMFFSYGFLHTGFWHFALNMVTLLSLAPPLVGSIGQTRFLVLWALSIAGGAIGYAALSNMPVPMVGASGRPVRAGWARWSGSAWPSAWRITNRLPKSPAPCCSLFCC